MSDSLLLHGLQHTRLIVSSTMSWSLLTFIAIELLMQSNCIILCCPLLLLPSVFPSIKFLSSELTLQIRWPKYWSFSFSNSPSSSGLISFRIGWFDLLAVQGTLRSLLQHHNSMTNILFLQQINAMPTLQITTKTKPTRKQIKTRKLRNPISEKTR